ncbi:hypothetical protein [Campylobacter sp.]|uniref:coiled-coil domain-containing protein n=1 Tax=Campylobacter sp. TaxID=205 RepID=UPI0025C47481|nr:hypothetical protein [Campylobacter sp.]
MSEFNTISIKIEDKRGIDIECELINKIEVDCVLREKNKELEKITNELKQTQDKLNSEKERANDFQVKLSSALNELEKTTNELNQTKDKLAIKSNELEKTKSEFKRTQNELAIKLNELEKTANELDNIKENTHFSLYKYYQTNQENLKEFTNNDLKDQCNFLVEVFNLNALKNLYQIIQTKTQRESNDLEYYVDFFEKLYKTLERYHNNLERYETKEGEKFDTQKHDKIRGVNQGKIKKVLFTGFKISDQKYNSLVEVE